MHPLLERQLRRLYGRTQDVPSELKDLIDIVDRTYHESDQDRAQVERSLDLMSDELLARNNELRDRIAEMERMHKELAKGEERLRELLDGRTRFINGMAHELATPLTPVILGLANLRRQMAKGVPVAPQKTDIIERNIFRLRNLVHEMLDATRVQSGTIQLRMEPTDLAAVIRASVSTYRLAAAEKGVALHLTPGPECAVLADESRLGQVLDNLLSNAVKFTPTQGNVHVVWTVEGGKIQICVKDDGSGIASGSVSNLFQPFNRFHKDRDQVEGTGLGLFLAKGLALRHGGDLVYDPLPDEPGARFVLTLAPLEKPYREQAFRSTETETDPAQATP